MTRTAWIVLGASLVGATCVCGEVHRRRYWDALETPLPTHEMAVRAMERALERDRAEIEARKPQPHVHERPDR